MYEFPNPGTSQSMPLIPMLPRAVAMVSVPSVPELLILYCVLFCVVDVFHFSVSPCCCDPLLGLLFGHQIQLELLPLEPAAIVEVGKKEPIKINNFLSPQETPNFLTPRKLPTS